MQLVDIFREKLSDIMRNMRVSQTDLAKLLNTPATAISRMLSEDGPAPRFATVDQIAQALKVPVTAFFCTSTENIASAEALERYIQITNEMSRQLKCKCEQMETLQKRLESLNRAYKAEREKNEISNIHIRALHDILDGHEKAAVLAMREIETLKTKKPS